MSHCRAFYFAFYDFSFSHYVGQSPFLPCAVCVGERGAVRCARGWQEVPAGRWVPGWGARRAQGQGAAVGARCTPAGVRVRTCPAVRVVSGGAVPVGRKLWHLLLSLSHLQTTESGDTCPLLSSLQPKNYIAYRISNSDAELVCAGCSD